MRSVIDDSLVRVGADCRRLRRINVHDVFRREPCREANYKEHTPVLLRNFFCIPRGKLKAQNKAVIT